jgi:hypothetical protein
MTTLQLEVQLSPADLVQVVDRFSVLELQQLIAQLVVIASQRQVAAPSVVVSDVLLLVGDQERRLEELRGMIAAGAAEVAAGMSVDGEAVFAALEARIAEVAIGRSMG